MDRQAIIERERKWAAPAATAAVLALILYIVSFAIDRAASLYTGASDARQLVSIHEHASTVLLGSLFRAATFLLLPLPMLYLFRAAQARNPRVHAVMVGFVVIGPLLFAVQGVIQAKGAGNVARDFVKLTPEPTKSYGFFQHQVKGNPASIDKVTIYTAPKPDQLEVQETNGFFYKLESVPASAANGLSATLDNASPSIDHETDSDSEAMPGDARAVHVTDNSSAIQTAQGLLFPAVLGLVVMMIYVPLQALRVGLLTRFTGSIGVALGASMIIILPLALLATLIWIGYLGLLIAGRVPGGQPPAWKTGEAIPWPRPGDQAAAPPPGGSGDSIEGQASEVSEEEPAATSQPAGPSQERRKRKRRR